jgi:hypothetical protein
LVPLEVILENIDEYWHPFGLVRNNMFGFLDLDLMANNCTQGLAKKGNCENEVTKEWGNKLTRIRS